MEDFHSENIVVGASGKEVGAVDKETFMKAFEDVSSVTVGCHCVHVLRTFISYYMQRLWRYNGDNLLWFVSPCVCMCDNRYSRAETSQTRCRAYETSCVMLTWTGRRELTQWVIVSCGDVYTLAHVMCMQMQVLWCVYYVQTVVIYSWKIYGHWCWPVPRTMMSLVSSSRHTTRVW